MIFMSVGYLSQEQLGRKVIMHKDGGDCYALLILMFIIVGSALHDVGDELKSNDSDNHDCKGIISDGKVG